MKLYTGWNAQTQEATAETIWQAIETADQLPLDPFVIANQSSQWYLQTLRSTAGFVIEKREGDGESHYRAINLRTRSATEQAPEMWGRLLSVGQKRDRSFLPDEVFAAFIAYASGQPEPAILDWERIDV